MNTSKVTCYHCSEKGPFAKTCQNRKTKNEAQVHTQVAEEPEDEEKKGIRYIWYQNCLLIDSKSSVDVFNNNKYLTGNHNSNSTVMQNVSTSSRRDGFM